MIYLYSGTPGSGKSLHVAKEILEYARAGRGIMANFPVTPTKKQLKSGKLPLYVDNSELTPDYLKRYAYRHHKRGIEGQTVLVIDECQIMFNSRDFRNADRMEWITFFAQHRKYGYSVILVSQHDRLLDRQIRAFIEYEVKHRKVNHFGVVGAVFTLLRLKLFIWVEMWYGLREKTGSKFFLFHKKYAALYDSYMDFSGEWDESLAADGEPGDETTQEPPDAGGSVPGLGG